MFGKVNNPKGINQWSNIGAVLKAQVKKVGNTVGAKLKTAKSAGEGLKAGLQVNKHMAGTIAKNASKDVKAAAKVNKGMYAGAKLGVKVENAVNDTVAKVKNRFVDIGVQANKREIKRGMQSAADNAKSTVSHAAGMVTKKLKGVDTKKAVNAVVSKGDSALASARKGVNRGVAGAKNIGLELNHKVTGGAASKVKTTFGKAKNNAVGSAKNAAIDAGVVKRKIKRSF